MSKVRLTKNELRLQQRRLTQLQRYLPTLQLKKAMLQLEVQGVRQEIELLEEEYERQHAAVEGYSALYSDDSSVDWSAAVRLEQIHKRYENVAGVELPYFEGVSFVDYPYALLETPIWVDSAIASLRLLATRLAAITVLREKKEALERELRDVSIRVNLFEKVLIPRAETNIRRIRVFLGDQELAAVSRAKVAKTKIERRRSAAASAAPQGEELFDA